MDVTVALPVVLVKLPVVLVKLPVALVTLPVVYPYVSTEYASGAHVVDAALSVVMESQSVEAAAP